MYKSLQTSIRYYSGDKDLVYHYPSNEYFEVLYCSSIGSYSTQSTFSNLKDHPILEEFIVNDQNTMRLDITTILSKIDESLKANKIRTPCDTRETSICTNRSINEKLDEIEASLKDFSGIYIDSFAKVIDNMFINKHVLENTSNYQEFVLCLKSDKGYVLLCWIMKHNQTLPYEIQVISKEFFKFKCVISLVNKNPSDKITPLSMNCLG